MDIADVALKINKLVSNYKMAEFQAVRKKLKNLTRTHSTYIFGKQSIKAEEGYAFHLGGRKELQYNISDEEDRFRYGVAFSLDRSQSLTDPISKLKPKIDRYNEYIKCNADAFRDMSFFYPKKRPIGIIENDLIQEGNFIFIGKKIKKPIKKLNDDDYDEILKTFDRLLDLYCYVESDTPTIKILKKVEPSFVPGHKPGMESTKAQYVQREIDVNLLHSIMLNKSVSQLAKVYGENNVSTHHVGGFKVDLTVKENDSLTFYEFKTADSIQSCIREALGQLLEYAYYPNQNRASKLIIVSQNKINKESQEYLKKLREDFNIPIYYKHYNCRTDSLK